MNTEEHATDGGRWRGRYVGRGIGPTANWEEAEEGLAQRLTGRRRKGVVVCPLGQSACVGRTAVHGGRKKYFWTVRFTVVC